MNKADQCAETYKHIKAFCHQRWIGFVNYVKRKVNERRAKKQQENPSDRAARVTARATVYIAIFTLLLAVVSGWTLYEIHSNSSDTDLLAKAAYAQAMVAFQQSKTMQGQLDQMKQQLPELQRSAESAEIAANAASEQVNSTERSLAVTSAAYCAGHASEETFPSSVSVMVICSPGRVYGSLLNGSFTVDILDIKTNTVVRHIGKFAFKPQPLKPGNSSIPKTIEIPQVDSSYVRVEGAFRYDDGFHHSLPSTFCSEIVGFNDESGNRRVMLPRCGTDISQEIKRFNESQKQK